MIFYKEGGDTLAQVVQSSYGCLSPENIQGEVGQDLVQPDLVEDIHSL